MITEDYVSFETAKLLREKGFDIYGYASIKVFGGHTYEVNGEWINVKEDTIIPTLQMAMKWLREVHGLFIGTVFQLECLSKEDKWFWKWNISDKGNKFALVEFGESDTYEEACEAAIKYCLENLI